MIRRNLQRCNCLHGTYRTCYVNLQVERTAPASNTHEESPENSFVSYSLELFPALGGVDSADGWAPQDGSINSDLLAASPDHIALQNTLWDSWMLGVAYAVTGVQVYRERGTAILESSFVGADALLPNMQYARLIPQSSVEDSRINPLGFQEMNDVGLALDAAALLDLTPASSSSFDNWMWYALALACNISTSGRLPAALPFRHTYDCRLESSSNSCLTTCICPTCIATAVPHNNTSSS